jgi:hypothetical protein
VSTVLVPLTAEDYAPEVAQATHGTDCLVSSLGENNWPAFLTSFAQAGAKQRLYGYQGNLDAKTVAPFPAQTQGAVVVGYYSDITVPAWANYRAAIAQFHAPKDEDYNSLGGLGTWAAYYALNQIVDTMTGPITGATFLAAAQVAKVNMDGMAPNADFAAKFTGLGKYYTNDTNRAVTYDIVKNGKLTPFENGAFYDMTASMLGQPVPAADLPPAGDG